MNPGEALERLVSVLEKALAVNQNVTVESRKRLRDKITGRLREHDVVITIKQSHHTLTVAIECRDRSRKITVAEIEAFNQKCIDTWISRGIIVSTKGFCNTAITKAAHYGIQCFSLQEAERFNWMTFTHINLEERNIEHIHWHVFPKPPHNLPSDFLNKYELVDELLNPIDLQQLTPFIDKQLAQILKKTKSMIPSPISLQVNTNGLSAKEIKTGAIIPLSHLVADVTYNILSKQSPVKLISYAEENTDEEHQAAIASIDIGSIKGRLVLTKMKNKSTKIVFVNDTNEK